MQLSGHKNGTGCIIGPPADSHLRQVHSQAGIAPVQMARACGFFRVVSQGAGPTIGIVDARLTIQTSSRNCAFQGTVFDTACSTETGR
jgi:hypothetical protein